FSQSFCRAVDAQHAPNSEAKEQVRRIRNIDSPILRYFMWSPLAERPSPDPIRCVEYAIREGGRSRFAPLLDACAPVARNPSCSVQFGQAVIETFDTGVVELPRLREPHIDGTSVLHLCRSGRVICSIGKVGGGEENTSRGTNDCSRPRG